MTTSDSKALPGARLLNPNGAGVLRGGGALPFERTSGLCEREAAFACSEGGRGDNLVDAGVNEGIDTRRSAVRKATVGMFARRRAP